MTEKEIFYHASEAFRNAVSAEGDLRQHYLKQARNILMNLSDSYPGKKELEKKINAMLY